MAFSPSFILGILLLAVAGMFGVLPGSARWTTTLATAPVLLFPLLAWGVAIVALRNRRPGRIDLPAAIGLRLLPGTLPCCYFVWLTVGGWFDLSNRAAQGSTTLLLGLLFAPLLLLEMQRIVGAGHLQRLAVQRDLHGVPATPGPRLDLALLGVITVPCLLYGIAVDVLAQWRPLSLFLRETSIGALLGAGTMVLALCVLLPLLFRWFVVRGGSLPSPLAYRLRAVAAALGFPPGNVLQMDTGRQMMNAMMVGHLAWPRYLLLTDLILEFLGPRELEGVVAHEAAHARAGHPTLLVLLVSIPVLLSVPAMHAGVEELDFVWLAAITVAAVGVTAWSIRFVAHRFEHEADVIATQALGGAAACARALETVGRLTSLDMKSASMLHPSEVRRIATMRAFEQDPVFRDTFVATGRRLRLLLLGGVFGSLCLTTWSWWTVWPIERSAWLYHTGNFPAARAQMATVTEVRAGVWDSWQHLQQCNEAALAIAPDGGEWDQLAPMLAREGRRRGIEQWLRQGPALASPWLTLAAAADGGRDVLLASMAIYCDAARQGDTAAMEHCAAHLRELGVPDELRPVFGQ